MPSVFKIALLTALLAMAAVGCRAGKGESCQSKRCQDALACIDDVCLDCATSDRCKSYGMCALSAGRCEVPAADDAACRNGHGSDKHVPCTREGKCSVKDGVCAAVSNDDCKQGVQCKGSGACTAKDGACIVASSDDCKSTNICAAMARCTLVDGACSFTSDADCVASSMCKNNGHCSKKDDKCVATKDDDCAASVMCKAHGECTAEGGRCVRKQPTQK